MRQTRKLLQGAKYHVIARTAGKLLLIETDLVKDMFLEVVQRASFKYEFRIENFCILGNHFHFIIQPLGGANLSEIMKWILGVFAMKYNRAFKSWGHFWGDRFFSRPIVSFWEYLHVFIYIDRNPLKASLVESADAWKYSGLWHLQKGICSIITKIPPWFSLVFPTHRPLAISGGRAV